MRIGANAPNQRILLARSDNKKNWSARATRKKLYNEDAYKIETLGLEVFKANSPELMKRSDMP